MRLALLFAAGMVVSGAAALGAVQPNDEGLMLQAAARIAAGQVPYADFWWFYPPGQAYLLGGLEALLGPSLLWWRIVRVLADAGVAILAFALARRLGASPGVALAAWAVSVLAMATPSGPHPFPVALALALGALLAFERRPALAGVLAGACAAWRIEFAAALAAGVGLGLLLSGRRRALLEFAGAAVAAGLVLFVPVVATAGLRPSFDLLVDYPLTDFRDYQALPFPLAYGGPLNTSGPGGFLRDSAEPLLLHFLPLVLVLGLAGALLALALARRLREPLLAATAVLSFAMLLYLLTRADLFHTAPLAVVGSVLGAAALGSAARGARLVPVCVAAFALLYCAIEGLDRRSLALREDTRPLRLGVADGVRVPSAQARALEGAVGAIRAQTTPGDPIYVATRRADRVTAGNPLLYVLAGRPNPSRYDIAAPGVVTSLPVQREIVAALERTRTRVVVRDTSPGTAAPEPNAAGRSSGVRLLDEYLARRYRPAARYGSLRLLVRRP